MTVFEYMQDNKNAFHRMAAAGIVSMRLLWYYDIYEWHIANGCSKKGTAEHFGQPQSTIGYAVSRMTQQMK